MKVPLDVTKLQRTSVRSSASLRPVSETLVVLVRREDYLQCVEEVLPSFLSRPALAERPGDFHHARNDPALLVGILEGDRQA